VAAARGDAVQKIRRTGSLVMVIVPNRRKHFRDGAPLYENVKSNIWDIANDHGNPTLMGVRSIEFFLADALVAISAANASFYATTATASNIAEYAFDTSLSKTGTSTGTTWGSASGNPTNQRLIIVFDTPITFDKIIYNNFHHNGTQLLDVGAKDVKVHNSTDAITSTVYDEAIANSELIAETSLLIHTSADVVDDQILPFL
jgi:hypothetical protein